MQSTMQVVSESRAYRDTIFCSPSTISTMKWDPASYMEQRITMVKTIMTMFKKRHEERGQASVHALPLLSRRLELCLCLTASTFEEYFNMYSLKRRMHSLVLLLMSDSSIKPHEFLPPGFGAARVVPSKKRSHSGTSQCSGSPKHCKRRKLVVLSGKCPTRRTGILFLHNREDLIHKTYEFLTGVETVRHRAVNRFAFGFLKTCVTSLALSLAGFTTLVESFDLTEFFSSFPMLQDLRIGNVEQMEDLEFPQVRRVPVQAENHRRPRENESYIERLALALENQAAPKLKHIALANVFSSSPSNKATYALMQALFRGACPDLEYLGFSGNSTRDDGALIIAKFFRMGACSKVRCLDLRQNFIGVRGLEAVCQALCHRSCPNIEALCFGGNILVDDAVCHLLDVVVNENCEKIRFLGLEHNFITSRGIAQLAAKRNRAHIVDLSKVTK